ncbi:MAG: hypothetical protein QOD06_1383, partial [Candidatus Binatota bacterium]|nr:hypothetical protein [Candidatus Binatota bacterium]
MSAHRSRGPGTEVSEDPAMPEPDDDRGALEPLWTPADVARLLGLGGGDAAVYELCRARA